MDERTSKRTKLSSEDLEGEDAASNDDLIARLLGSQTESASTSLQGRPIIQDLSREDADASSFPTFDLPDLSSSNSLLARLQAFLPQIQQANLELPKDGSAGDDFQLIEQDDDAEEGDNRSQQDIIVPRAGGEPDSDEEDEEDPEPNPQIVFDLALGVLEPKQPQHGRTGEDASSSESKESNDSDDQEESDSAESSDASDEEDEDEENGSVDEAELSSGGGNAGPGPSAASPKQRDSSNVSVAPLSESKQTRKLVEEID